MSWLLILYLASGQIAVVMSSTSAAACYARSQFEMRYDSRVQSGYCLPLRPETEA